MEEIRQSVRSHIKEAESLTSYVEDLAVGLIARYDKMEDEIYELKKVTHKSNLYKSREDRGLIKFAKSVKFYICPLVGMICLVVANKLTTVYMKKMY